MLSPHFNYLLESHRPNYCWVCVLYSYEIRERDLLIGLQWSLWGWWWAHLPSCCDEEWCVQVEVHNAQHSFHQKGIVVFRRFPVSTVPVIGCCVRVWEPYSGRWLQEQYICNWNQKIKKGPKMSKGIKILDAKEIDGEGKNFVPLFHAYWFL